SRAALLPFDSNEFQALDLRGVPAGAEDDRGRRSLQCDRARYKSCIRNGSGGDCGKLSKKLLDKRRARPRGASSSSARAEARPGRSAELAPQKRHGPPPEPRLQGPARLGWARRSPLRERLQSRRSGRCYRPKPTPIGKVAYSLSLRALLPRNLLSRSTLAQISARGQT